VDHKAFTNNRAQFTRWRFCGRAIAGLLVVTAGYEWAFTIDGISYLAVLAGLWMMRSEELYTPARTARRRGQVREGVRYIRTLPELWVPLVMAAVVGTLSFNFPVVLPLFVERTLHGTDGSYTLLYSVLSVGSFAGALLTAHRRSVEVRHVVYASVAFGVSMLLLCAMPTLGAAFPVGLLVGFASIGFMTTSTAIVQVRADPSMRGRVLALQAMVLIGSTPIGGPILGYVCDSLGPRAGVALGGVAALAAAGWGALATRRHRRASEQTTPVEVLEAQAVSAEMEVA
jgi:predicted MFS family arabinose efflux permease